MERALEEVRRVGHPTDKIRLFLYSTLGKAGFSDEEIWRWIKEESRDIEDDAQQYVVYLSNKGYTQRCGKLRADNLCPHTEITQDIEDLFVKDPTQTHPCFHNGINITRRSDLQPCNSKFFG